MTAENNHSSRIAGDVVPPVSLHSICECVGFPPFGCLVMSHSRPQFKIRRRGVILYVCEQCDLTEDEKLETLVWEDDNGT